MVLTIPEKSIPNETETEEKEKMKKQERRKEKGITLVALVITIIVLIILAGITLNIVLDNDGIINKTKQGAEEYEKQRFFANKLYIDYLWTLWGKTRVAYDGEFMNHYAQERYERLKENLKKFGEIKQ